MQLKTVDDAVAAYPKAFNDPGISVAEVKKLVRDGEWTFENVRVMLMHRSNSFLLFVFAFAARF